MNELLPRGVSPRLSKLMRAVPVIVLEGPHASGKTALGTMLQVGGDIRTMVDLSDPTVRSAAESSPSSFIDSLATPAFIDEAQLVPELPVAVKRRVDRDRVNGAFVLTGSSRLGRAQLGGSDPLAGRAARVRLWPMTQAEIAGGPINFVDAIVRGSSPGAALPGAALDPADLLGRIRRGGLPNLAGVTAPIDDMVRNQLMREYVEGVLYHEVGQRHDRAELLRTLQYLASTTSRLLNVSAVANEIGARRETIQLRLASLEAAFMLHLLPSHRPTEHRTLTAHPKVHSVDCGVASWAARIDNDPPPAVWGGLVETFVVNELVAQAGWLDEEIVVRHWRDSNRRVEIDALLIRPNGESIPIEVKAAADVRSDDLTGIRAYLTTFPSVKFGVILYSGSLTLEVADQIWAVPISALWNGLTPTA